MIPYSFIQDLKNRCSIEDVISSYVTLKRAGSNLKGLCPFHSEKTPSFTVFPATQGFYCFGCGAGGDVISFTMRTENLEYVQAIEALAMRCGIPMPETSARSDSGVSRSRVIEMNTAAARFFRDILNDEKLGARGRSYVEERQLSSAIVRRFGIGYAPDSFDMLRNHLREKGFTDNEMTEGFLCSKSKKNGNLYDIFRDRLIFPIIDVSGNVVAFGGRRLNDSVPGKYVNTSDTPAFKKSKNLFALNYAKANCKELLILCEGYMDVVQLHDAGFENAVATLGTAITPEHARIMKRYSPKTVICYDSDEPGQRAAAKAITLLEEAGVEARVIKMEGAKDPDEYIKKFGKSEFEKLLSESRTKFDFKLDGIKRKYDIGVPEQKIRALSDMCDYIAEIYSRVEREVYIGRASKEFSIEPANIAFDVESAIKRKEKKRRAADKEELLRTTSGMADRVNRDFAKLPRTASLEETVLGLVLLRHEYITEKVDGAPLSCEDFSTDFGRRMLSFISEAEANGGFDIGMLSEVFTQDEVSRAVELYTRRMKLDDNGSEVFRANVRPLRAEREKLRNEASGTDDIMSIINRRRAEDKPRGK